MNDEGYEQQIKLLQEQLKQSEQKALTHERQNIVLSNEINDLNLEILNLQKKSIAVQNQHNPNTPTQADNEQISIITSESQAKDKKILTLELMNKCNEATIKKLTEENLILAKSLSNPQNQSAILLDQPADKPALKNSMEQVIRKHVRATLQGGEDYQAKVESELQVFESSISSLQQIIRKQYYGQIHNALPHGFGVQMTETDTYIGQFVTGERCGFGVLKFANSTELYEGQFKNNKQNGVGKLTLENGEVYDGELIDGVPNGKGALIEPNGDVYSGYFINGLRFGKGKQVTKDNDIYDGEWKDDEMDGQGVMQYFDGRVYSGVFSQSNMVSGKMIWQDGTIYEGGWKNGLMDGKGKMKFVDGKKLNGWFSGGKFVGDDEEAAAWGDVGDE